MLLKTIIDLSPNYALSIYVTDAPPQSRETIHCKNIPRYAPHKEERLCGGIMPYTESDLRISRHVKNA